MRRKWTFGHELLVVEMVRLAVGFGRLAVGLEPLEVGQGAFFYYFLYFFNRGPFS